jgi:hypothetical protein
MNNRAAYRNRTDSCPPCGTREGTLPRAAANGFLRIDSLLKRSFPLIRLQGRYSAVNENGRFANAGLEQPGEVLGKHRPTEIVSLRLVT